MYILIIDYQTIYAAGCAGLREVVAVGVSAILASTPLLTPRPRGYHLWVAVGERHCARARSGKRAAFPRLMRVWELPDS